MCEGNDRLRDVYPDLGAGVLRPPVPAQSVLPAHLPGQCGRANDRFHAPCGDLSGLAR
jgi:hypothetical protein